MCMLRYLILHEYLYNLTLYKYIYMYTHTHISLNALSIEQCLSAALMVICAGGYETSVQGPEWQRLTQWAGEKFEARFSHGLIHR